MGHCDAGMFDYMMKSCGVKVGDGKTLTVAKIGKKAGILTHIDGTKMNIMLENYKHVPGLWVNLFSVTQAMSSGWNLKSDGRVIMLVKVANVIKFDKVMTTGDGYVYGVDVLPQLEAAAPTLSQGSIVDINSFHQILNHCGEDSLRLTAQAHGIQLTGILKPCFACATANARQKNVAKVTKVMAQKIGERLYIDISSVEQKAHDGARFWVLVVDDKSNKSWSFFVSHRDQQVDPVFELLLLLHKNKTPVKYIRADNAGENKLLQEAVHNHRFLKITFEFTPRNSPQCNGCCEWKFAYLWSCIRSLLNAAKIPKNI